LIGFHGQTIFHSPDQKISKQLGDGKLMSQLVKKKVFYDFRQEDIANKGEGAPLSSNIS
jgi:anhydro-N-acetylmuramic acid kinase